MKPISLLILSIVFLTSFFFEISQAYVWISLFKESFNNFFALCYLTLFLALIITFQLFFKNFFAVAKSIPVEPSVIQIICN